LKQGRIEFLDVAGDHVVGGREIADLRPDEIDGIAGLGIGGARRWQRPDDVFGRERRAVVPGHPLRTFILIFLLSSVQPHSVIRPGVNERSGFWPIY